jgi:hypothetical protein
MVSPLPGGPGILDAPTARLMVLARGSDSNGHLAVFGIDKDGSMQQDYQETPAGGPWYGWADGLGGDLAQPAPGTSL